MMLAGSQAGGEAMLQTAEIGGDVDATQTREKLLIRDRLIADAGPFLGPALEYYLEYDSNNFPGRGSRDEPVQRLLGADVIAKGKAFSHLLDLIVTPSAGSGERPAQEF